MLSVHDATAILVAVSVQDATAAELQTAEQVSDAQADVAIAVHWVASTHERLLSHLACVPGTIVAVEAAAAEDVAQDLPDAVKPWAWTISVGHTRPTHRIAGAHARGRG